MIIIINSNGAVVGVQDEDLFQGSTNLNNIDLIAPFADSVTFKAMFEMPDGTYRPADLDGYIFKPSLKVDRNLNTWRLPITFPITQDYGLVTMQIRGTIGDTVVCSTSVKMSIQKGVPYASDYEDLPDKEQILQMIAELRALLSNKVDKVQYNYTLAEDVTETTIGTYYVIQLDEQGNVGYIPKTLPDDYDSTATYYSLQSTTRVTSDGTNLFLECVNNITNNSTKLEVRNDKVLINDSQVVTFEDLKAENVEYDDTNTSLSAETVQDALEKLKQNIDNSASILDVGDITIPHQAWQQDGSVYVYINRHEKLTDALTQSIIITPNDAAINALNNNDVLLYPEIDIYSASGAPDVVYFKITADKRPSFDIVANMKIVKNKVDGDIAGITASQISYSNTIGGDTVRTVGDALSKLKNTDIGFTYIIDSNLKLRTWASNTAGNDYTSVLIKKGTYTYANAIDLQSTGTVLVYAEPGSTLRCDGLYGNLSIEGTSLFNVKVELTTDANGSAFNHIKNLYNCIAVIGASTNTAITVYGFANCMNLIGCTAEGLSGRLNNTYVGFYSCENLDACWSGISYPSKGYGFELCNKLNNCTAYSVDCREQACGFKSCKILSGCQGRGTLLENTGVEGTGYGFDNCKGVHYCSKFDQTGYTTSTTGTFNLTNCYADISSTEYNPDYIVASTPAGGFNDIT